MRREPKPSPEQDRELSDRHDADGQDDEANRLQSLLALKQLESAGCTEADLALAKARLYGPLPDSADEAEPESQSVANPYDVWQIVVRDGEFSATLRPGVASALARGYISHRPGEAEWLSPPAPRRSA